MPYRRPNGGKAPTQAEVEHLVRLYEQLVTTHQQIATRAPGHEATAGTELTLLGRDAEQLREHLEFWTRLERDGFRARLRYAASERPSVPVGAPAR